MNLRILSYELVPDDRYYVFNLNIKYKDWAITITKRYSEFLELHRVMKLIQKNTGAALPAFPKKMKLKYFLRIVTENDMENRRVALEVYMKELERGQITRHSKYFADFLGLPMRFRDEWLANKQIL